MNKNKWVPILKAEQNQLDRIAAVLENFNYGKGYSLLGDGNMGPAILLYYYGKYTCNNTYLEKANSMILENFEISPPANPSAHSLCNGTAGFRWGVDHLINNGFIDGDADELFADDDMLLYAVMEKDLSAGNYDYLHNAIGIGTYFLNRKNNEARVYVSSLIDGLANIAKTDKNGIKWMSMANLEANSSKPVYNLSLSHGMASIVLFLAKAHQAGIAVDQTKELIFKTMSYILSQKQHIPDASGSYFPSMILVEGDQPVQGGRLAWCYGDLGLGFSLWQVAKIMENKEWEKLAIDVLLHTTSRRDPLKENVIDAGICHGSAGLAHIYNRMYQHTGINEFKDTAIYWLEDTLKKAVFPDGLAGYKAWHSHNYGGWKSTTSLIEGISGIGLVLLAAVSDIEPNWDECFLLS